ncbi:MULTISPECIES: hypothetical protein [Streptomyces]
MDTEAATGLLHLIAAEPTLLAPAERDAQGDTLLHRDRGERHLCLGCGHPASCAVIVHSPAGDRWLDLCATCWPTIRRANDVG